MFTLYRHGDFHRKSSPEDYALVLSPNSALELATQYYDLNPRHHSMLGFREAPRRLSGNPTWTRASTGYADPVYDYVKQDLRIGWFIGIDFMGEWNPHKNPFYVDENGHLVCPESHYYHAWFVQEIMSGYRDAVQARNGMKARPTQRLRNYGGAGEPEQHAQAGKTINSKAAGRLLAAGGIYNGNIDGFHETAQQLGGDAPAGYDQVMDNKGLLVAGASIAAELTMGRVNLTGELEELSSLSKIPTFESPALKGFTSESGALLNADHAIVDYRKLSTYSLDVTHPKGGHKARVFQSALGYNPTNSDVLAGRVQEGILTAPAKVLDANQHGQRMAVDMPILGANGETVIVRSGWIYEPDAVVPRMTTIFVK